MIRICCCKARIAVLNVWSLIEDFFQTKLYPPYCCHASSLIPHRLPCCNPRLLPSLFPILLNRCFQRLASTWPQCLSKPNLVIQSETFFHSCSLNTSVLWFRSETCTTWPQALSASACNSVLDNLACWSTDSTSSAPHCCAASFKP
jgi:hypothetical protein